MESAKCYKQCIAFLNFDNTGGKPPADSIMEKDMQQTISSDLFIGMTTLAVAGIILALGFLAFNVHYRNRRYV